MFDHFEKVGMSVDIPALRALFPSVRWHTFGDWTRTHDWSALLG